jgi:hypothetical protein
MRTTLEWEECSWYLDTVFVPPHDTLDAGRMIRWMGGLPEPVVGEIDQGIRL